MKILLCSHRFHPSVGGTEAVSEVLAEEFQRAGHEVRVVTATTERGAMEFPFPVLRRPSARELWQQVRWSELVFHNNISLQTAWPLLLMSRPWVVAHHTWLRRVDGGRGWRERLKQRVLRRATNIAVSDAVAKALSAPAVVIGNPYRDDIFRTTNLGVRRRELVFVGRLVSEKGADLLLEALAQLRSSGAKPALTVVGTGPEEEKLREQARALGLEEQVRFAGAQSGLALAALLNEHRLLVVPSRCEETFGIAALEGIACGCAVVASDGGGLPSAVGPCGVLFPRGDAAALADTMGALLQPEANLEIYRAAAAKHLARHQAAAVAWQYLSVFTAARNAWARGTWPAKLRT